MKYLLGMLKVQTYFFQYKGAEMKLKQYGRSDFKIVQYLNILISDTPFWFAYILAPEYRTEKFLYSRRTMSCPNLLACL